MEGQTFQITHFLLNLMNQFKRGLQLPIKLWKIYPMVCIFRAILYIPFQNESIQFYSNYKKM
jgi:hypothetical protein